MGLLELVIVLAIVLVIFGAAKLPAVGGALGRMIRNFKAASASRDEIEVKPEQRQEIDRGTDPDAERPDP
jgi:sec-independent protein translocase protein TatA